VEVRTNGLDFQDDRVSEGSAWTKTSRWKRPESGAAYWYSAYNRGERERARKLNGEITTARFK